MNSTDYNVLWYNDRDPIVKTHPVLAMCLIVFVSITMVAGVAGNLLLIAAIAMTKSLQTAANAFIVVLAFFDLSITAITEPTQVLSIVLGARFYTRYPWVCQLLGTFCSVSCTGSPAALGLISINRYICICHNVRYAKAFGKWATFGWIVFLLVYATSTSWVGLLNFGNIWYDKKLLICVLNRSYGTAFTVFTVLMLCGIPIISVGIFNIMIYAFVKKMRRAVAGEQSTSERQRKKRIKEDLRLVQTLVTVFLVLLVCTAPYGALLLIDAADKIALEAYAIASAMYHTNSSLNPIIYGLMNRNFANAYKSVIYRLLCLTRRVPAQSNEKSMANNTVSDNTMPLTQ